MNPEVFVSHASEDKERFVTDFATRLRGKGIDAWFAEWEILPGDSLIDKIYEEGIKDAEAIIVVLSKNSVSKPWVRDELNAAVIKRIQGISKLIPVVIDDCNVPEALQTTVWETIGDLNDYDSAFEHIVSAIYEHRDRPPLGRPPAHTSTIMDVIPELTKLDSLVLKLACEKGCSNGIAFVGDIEALLDQARSLDIPEQEFYESLEILHSRRYIKLGRVFDPRRPISHLGITLFGVESYARTYVEGYALLMEAIAFQILNNNQRSGLEISAALDRPIFIVTHVLDVFAANEWIRITKTSGKTLDTHIHMVEAEFRRRIQAGT